MPKPPKKETRGPPLRLQYRPEGGADVDALAFAGYLIESIRALKQTAALLSKGSVTVRYVVERLDKQSPEVVEIAPVAAAADQALIHRAQVAHVEALDGIARGEIPTYLDYPARLTYQRLGALSRKGHFKAQVSANGTSTTTGAELAESLNLQMAGEHTSYGTVRGHIHTYQSAGGRRLIRLVPRTGNSLIGKFRERDRVKIRGYIDVAYVEAEGLMRYRSGEYQPYFIDIERIRQLPVGDSPSFQDMDGFAPDLAGHRSADELVSEARDAW